MPSRFRHATDCRSSTISARRFWNGSRGNWAAGFPAACLYVAAAFIPAPGIEDGGGSLDPCRPVGHKAAQHDMAGRMPLHRTLAPQWNFSVTHFERQPVPGFNLAATLPPMAWRLWPGRDDTDVGPVARAASGRGADGVADPSAGGAWLSIPVGRNLVAVVPAMGRNYGAAQRAFVIVPLVCGFFIGIPNLLIIAGFVG